MCAHKCGISPCPNSEGFIWNWILLLFRKSDIINVRESEPKSKSDMLFTDVNLICFIYFLFLAQHLCTHKMMLCSIVLQSPFQHCSIHHTCTCWITQCLTCCSVWEASCLRSLKCEPVVTARKCPGNLVSFQKQTMTGNQMIWRCKMFLHLPPSQTHCFKLAWYKRRGMCWRTQLKWVSITIT